MNEKHCEKCGTMDNLPRSSGGGELIGYCETCKRVFMRHDQDMAAELYKIQRKEYHELKEYERLKSKFEIKQKG